VKKTAWMLLGFAFLSVGCARMAAEPILSGPMAANPNNGRGEAEPSVNALDPWGEDVVYAEALDDALVNRDQDVEGTPVHNDEAGSANAGAIEAEFLDDDLDFLEEDEATVVVSDPLAPWNRLMFQFNDKLYFWLIKPVSKGYAAVVPSPVRCSVQNFFTNLAAPIRMGSCIIQGKGTEAQAELARFLFNSTFGVGGLGNPSKDFPHLKRVHDEDMGQALAAHGVDNGFYIVWPVLGPSTARDTVGTVGDLFMNPVSYLPLAVSASMTGENKLNESSLGLGSYEALKDAAIDPYEAVRDAYLQYRQKKVEE